MMNVQVAARLRRARVFFAAVVLQAAAAHAAPGARLQVINDFSSPKDGQGPWSEFVQTSDGRYAGVACCGAPSYNGSIFSTNLQGATRTLHTFKYHEGNEPNGPLVQTSDGSLYGTAFSGGSTTQGTVFRLAADGTLTLLHTFVAADGQNPMGGLLLASDGNFYGTTAGGGAQGMGVAYRLTPAGELTVLHDFGANDQDGKEPEGMLLETADGSLIGTASGGGAGRGGTVFKLGRDGSYATLAAFDVSGGGPSGPHEGLVDGHDGWLYGTTSWGGSAGQGTVYRMKIGGQPQVLHSFAGGAADGANPSGRLCVGSDGLFYGMAPAGGGASLGVAFQVSSSGRYAVLHSFTQGDGAYPRSAPLQTGAKQFLGAAPSDGPAAHGDTFLLKLLK